MAEPAKVDFSAKKDEGPKTDAGLLGVSDFHPFSCCASIVIDPLEVRWANLNASDDTEGGVFVKFKDEQPPVFFAGLDGMRVIKILQEAGKDIPDA